LGIGTEQLIKAYAVTATLKAELATISRIAEDTTGSRQFTESVTIWAMAELILKDEQINWAEEFAGLRPEQVSLPIQAMKDILARHMNRRPSQ